MDDVTRTQGAAAQGAGTQGAQGPGEQRERGMQAAQAAGRATTYHAREGADRARQFMPFATLRGYYDAVKLQERQEAPRRTLQEHDIERISSVLARVQRGTMVRVVYYDRDAYVTLQGAVGEVVPAFRWLSVVKTRIAFEDIDDIEIMDGR